MSKMSGKQKVVGGFDLASFVGEAEGEQKVASHPKPHGISNQADATHARPPAKSNADFHRHGEQVKHSCDRNLLIVFGLDL